MGKGRIQTGNVIAFCIISFLVGFVVGGFYTLNWMADLALEHLDIDMIKSSFIQELLSRR